MALRVLIFFVLFAPLSLVAQRGWEVGAAGGMAYYFGDLNTEYNLRHPGPAIQGLLRFNFNNRLAWRLSGTWMRVQGSDQWSTNQFQQQRNLSVRTPLFDITSGLEFNFLEYEHGGDAFFTPYMYFGPAVYNFNPHGLYNGEWVPLRELGTEGQFTGEEYYATLFGLAFGGGFKVALNYHTALNIEFSGRRLFTDYLDDVSTTYPDMGDLASLRGPSAVFLSDPSVGPEKLGVEGRQRGDSKTRDNYTFLTVGFMYYFGDLLCPKWH